MNSAAAVFAVRRFARPPIQAMNETVNPEKPVKARGWIGIVMVALGAAFWVLCPAAHAPGDRFEQAPAEQHTDAGADDAEDDGLDEHTREHLSRRGADRAQ